MDEAHPPEDLETPPDDRPLIERIGDKNWKTRTAAYDDLKQLVGEAEAAPSLFTEFASWLPKMTADSNAGALDAGIDAAAAFVASAPVELLRPYCEKLVANAADKAFSGRASTISRGKALCHKLSEVDTPGPVALYLLTRLGDKKPKIPPTCLELLREGVEAFGVKAYPVREILKALPAVFNGSNSAARDAAMALLVELHRWLRRPPLQQLLDGLRTAQQSDFDKAVAEQETGAAAPVPSLYLRTSRPKEGEAPTPAPVAAPAAANDGAVDGREYADEVDLMKRLKTSEYGSLVADEKWSEQLRAMQIVIDAIGPVPKIKPGCDVGDLMSVIKGFLRQGHLQLQTASLKVIGLLADGLRREFGNSVRPLLQQVVGKSREKRLVPEVQGALLAVFTHCVPLDCINDDLIEFLASKKSPPHGRVCLLEVVLQVCGTLPEKVGSDMLKPLALALLEESEDSDPKVREAVVQALGGVAKLAKSRGRLAAGAYKAVLGAEASRPKVFKKIQAYMAGGEVPETRPSTLSSTMSSKKPSAAPSVLPSASTVSKKVPAASVSRKEAPPASASTTASASAEDDNVEELCLGEWEAEQALEAMGVPGWDKVKASLGKDAGWAEKVEALAALEKRCVELGEQGGCGQYSAALVAYLSASCGGFKISNVNILKAVMATCCAAAKHSTGEGQRFSRAAAWELIKQFVDKLGDKKAKEGVLGLLSALAESLGPSFVLRRGRQVLEKTPSPLAHQHLLEWLKQAVTDFGVAALPVPMCASFCLGEMDNKAAAVRGAAVEALGALYNQLGPRFSALALPSSLKPAVRVLLEAEFAKVGHDPAAPAPKAGAGAAGGAASSGGGGGGGVPRQDLCSLLPKDVVSELGYLEGKTSWIRRKAAMEAVVAACERAAHFLEANRPTGEVLKALKPRVGDTQANLKPLAVAAMGHIVGSLNPDGAGAKVLRSVGEAMLQGLGDNKKTMRDATVAALQMAVTGAGFDATEQASTSMVCALLPAVAEALGNVVGRQELLDWLLPHTEAGALRGDGCAELVGPLVGCLQDKATGVRTAAEALLTALQAKALVPRTAVDRATRDLPPAALRGLQAIVVRIEGAYGTAKPEPQPERVVPAPAATPASATVPAQITAAPASIPVAAPAAATPVRAAPPVVPSSLTRRVAAVTDEIAAALAQPVTPAAVSRAPTTPMAATVASALAAASTPVIPESAVSARWLLKRNAVGKQRRLEEFHALPWPLPPSDPGEPQLQALKAVWRPLLAPDLAFLLFPITRAGFPLSQEAFAPGMEALRSQLGCPHLSHHAEFSLRWCCLVLCLKQESPSGLLCLLQLLCDVLQALRGEEGLGEAEALCVLPHLLERAGHRLEAHQALFKRAAQLLVDCLPPAAALAALAQGLGSANKRSRVVCVLELKRLATDKGADSPAASGAVRVAAQHLDAADCDSSARAACLDCVRCWFYAGGGDLVRLRLLLGREVSEGAWAQVSACLERRDKAPSPAPATARASATATPSKALTPSKASSPAATARTSVTPTARTPPAPAAASAKSPAAPAVPIPTARTPPAAVPTAKTHVAVPAIAIPVRAIATTPQYSSPPASPSDRLMLQQIDAVMAGTPLHPQHAHRQSMIGPLACLSPELGADLPMENDLLDALVPMHSPQPPRTGGKHRESTSSAQGEDGDTLADLPLPQAPQTPQTSYRSLPATPLTAGGSSVSAAAELEGIYQDVLQKVDALLLTTHAVALSSAVQQEARDYLKVLHSIVSGEWSAEQLPEDEAALLMHAEGLALRLVGCVTRAFEMPALKGTDAEEGEDIAYHPEMDLSLLAISLSALFALVKRTEVAARLSDRALLAVFHGCLKYICDPRLSNAAASEGEAGKVAEQVVRALNMIVLKLAVDGAVGRVLAVLLRVLYCCIPASEVAPVHRDEHQPLPPHSIKPTSRLVIQVLSEQSGKADPYADSELGSARSEEEAGAGAEAAAGSLQQLLLAVHSFFTRHPTTTADDMPFRTAKTVLNEVVRFRGGVAVLGAMGETDIPKSAFIHMLVCRLGDVQQQVHAQVQVQAAVEESAKGEDPEVRAQQEAALHLEVSGVIEAITSSRDKVAAIRQLHALKQAHPHLDSAAYLSRISTAFRRYVLNTLAKLDAAAAEGAEQHEGGEPQGGGGEQGGAGGAAGGAASGGAGGGGAEGTGGSEGTGGTGGAGGTGGGGGGGSGEVTGGPQQDQLATGPACIPSSPPASAPAVRRFSPPAKENSHSNIGSEEKRAQPSPRKSTPTVIGTPPSKRSPSLVPRGLKPQRTSPLMAPLSSGKMKRFAFNAESKRMEVLVVDIALEDPSSPLSSLPAPTGESSPFVRRNDLIRNGLSQLASSLDLPEGALLRASSNEGLNA